MLSSYESGLRARVSEVASSRLLILGAFAIACALFRVGGLPLPWQVFATIGVWFALAAAVRWSAARVRGPAALTSLQTIALLADIGLITIVHLETAGGRWVGPVLSGIVVIAITATLPSRRAALLVGITIAAYGLVVFGTSTGLLRPGTFTSVEMPALDFRQAGAAAALGTLALLLLASAQRATARAIRRSEERYRLLLATATDMIFTVDRDGRLRSANDTTFAESGYGPDEVLDVPFTEFLVPEDRELAMEQFAATLRGEPRQYEARYRRADDTVRWLSISNSPIRERRRVIGSLSICRDVTERRGAEQRLAAEHRIARILAEADSFIEAAPPLLEELVRSFGFRAAALWSRSLLESEDGDAVWWYAGAGAADDAPPIIDAVNERCREIAIEVLASARVTWRRPEPLPRADGAERSLEVPLYVPGAEQRCTIFAFPLVAGGRTHAVVTLVRPGRAGVDAGLVQHAEIIGGQIGQAIEREKLHDELAQAHTMQTMGRLVSGVAHELNNPLTAVLGFAEQLLEGERPAEDREAIEVIHQQARRARAIVRDLLAVVRKSDDRSLQRVDLRAWLEQVERALRPRVEELGASLRVVCAGELPQPVLDPIGIEQVIANLVVNGTQATGPGGTVTIHARRRGGALEIVVEDDGPGIAADVMPRIFEPFFTTKAAGEGTGLGLPVSKGIIERHGGSLTAMNRPASLGGGARFVVTLPIEARRDAASEPRADAPVAPREAATAHEPALADRAAQAPAVPHRTAPPCVLVIDDEDVIRQAVRRWFERRGWSVLEAPNGIAALEMLAASAEQGRRPPAMPDVIICDLRMPEMTGMELHERLVETRPDLLRRIIFSTGDVASPEAATFLAGTECPVLEKPFELGVLAATVERVQRETLAA